MGIITRNCPHCNSRNMTFTAFADYADPTKASPQVYLTAFRCGGCHGGYFVEIVHRGGLVPNNYQGDIDAGEHLLIIREYPLPSEVGAPQYLPDNISLFFIQAAHSLNAGNFDASAMMARKVLEVAVKALDSNHRGSLFQHRMRLK